MLLVRRFLASIIAYAALVTFAHADQTEDERRAVWAAADKASVAGPSDVKLGDQAVLHLPDSMVYMPSAEGSAVMKMWGNSVGAGFHGLVFPKSTDASWAITLNHTAEGYVKDDDAKTWNADELLQSLKDGTEAQNEERAKMGIPGLEIIGWIQQPTYDSGSHKLVWSLNAKNQGAAADEPNVINYNTYALGRDGYFEIDLLTNEKTVSSDKSAANAVLAALDYNEGKTYEDFNASTDHIAEYGLGALVAGVAAKKLGLLAAAGLFFAKFAKIIVIGLAAGGAALFKLFRRNT